MHRSPYELAAHVRCQIAHLAAERRACSPLDRDHRRPANPLARLRHSVGLGLIRAGAALAGPDALPPLSVPAARPMTTARPGS